MRSLFLLAAFLICAGSLAAQEQESKTMERIMRPDMTLANPAQDKKFIAVEGTSVEKQFAAKSFYAGREQSTKSFLGLTSFFSRTFGTRSFDRAQAAAEAKASAEQAYASTVFATKKSALVRESADAKRTSALVRDYAGNRPFLGQGTRQKQLSQESHPLTIDEVRELLNKSR